MVRGWSGGLGAAAAAKVPRLLPTSARTAVTNLRIFVLPLSSVGQLELDAYAGRKIDRLAVPLGRFELDLLCRTDGGLIKTVAESADDVVYLDRAICEKNQVKYHVALYSHTTPFGGVLGTRLVENVNHGGLRIAGHCFFLGGLVLNGSIREAGALDRAAALPSTRRRNGNAIP